MSNLSNDIDRGYSISREIKISLIQVGIDVLVAKELGLINSEDLINLMKMLKSSDIENHTVVKTIIGNLLKEVDNVNKRKT